MIFFILLKFEHYLHFLEKIEKVYLLIFLYWTYLDIRILIHYY